jgi:hypothetical protein
MAFFVLTPLRSGSWQTAPLKRAPEQNVGQGNAPADSRPSPGVQKDSFWKRQAAQPTGWVTMDARGFCFLIAEPGRRSFEWNATETISR